MTTLRKAALRTIGFGVVLLLAATRVQAEPVGSVAAVDPRGEIGRAGTWSDAALGAGVEVADTLRTGETGRIKVLFRDDSVLNVGTASEIVVDEQVFNPNEGVFGSTMRLLQGRVRSMVSEYYGGPQASYQVETATAVSGVRGTDFVVEYDGGAERTDVIGVSGQIEVHSVLDLVGHGVIVGPGEMTTVVKGRYPTPPRQLDVEVLRRTLERFEFIGQGRAESAIGGEQGEGPIGGGERSTERGPGLGAEIAPDAGGLTPEDRSTPGGVGGQPPGAIDPRGDLNVPF